MTQMTEEWVLFWYDCLSQNQTFTEYCTAADQGDKRTCKRMEKLHPLLPELYKDFGTSIGEHPGGVAGESWRKWFEPRRHLFIQAVEQLVDPRTATSSSEGFALLRVPLQATATATLVLVRDYLNRLYATTSPSVAPAPKYRLHLRGQRVAVGYQQVRQAVVAGTKSYAIDLNGEYVSIRQAIVNFLRGELDNMGWKISTPAKAALMKEGGDLDEDTYEKFRVRLNKCRRDFEALSQNALHGRFPDTTPRNDSEVSDQFWGE